MGQIKVCDGLQHAPPQGLRRGPGALVPLAFPSRRPAPLPLVERIGAPKEIGL